MAVRPGQYLLREAAADDHYQRRVLVVGRGESTSVRQADGHRIEVARGDRSPIRVGSCRRCRSGLTFDGEGPGGVVSRQRQSIGGADRQDTGHSAQVVGGPLEESPLPSGSVVLPVRQEGRHHQRVIRLEAGIDPAQVLEGGEQQAGADQQHHRQRDLGDDENAERASMRAGGPSTFTFQRVVHIGPRRVPGRNDPEQDAGHDCDRDRKDQRPAIDVNLVGPGYRIGGGLGEDVGEPGGEQGTADAAERREHDALGNELADDPAAAGSQCGAHRDLPLTCGAAHQQQVGDVGAGNEQHETDRTEHEQHRRPRLADHQVLKRNQRDAGQVIGRALRAQGEARELSAGLLPGDVRREAHEDVVRMAVVERRQLRRSVIGTTRSTRI